MMTKRNVKGEGSVFQRSNGTWVAKITRNGVTKSKTAKNENEANKKLRELIKEEKRIERLNKNNSDFTHNPSKVLTTDVFKKFLEYKRAGRKKVSDTTYLRLESIVNYNILPECGNVPFLEIDKKAIEALLDKKKNDGYSYSTVKKIKEAFNMCFEFAVYEEGLVEPYENPTLGVVMPIYDMSLKEIPSYSTDEIQKITKECLKKTSNGKYIYRYGPFFLFMLNTGLREGEACALLKSDINIRERLVSVNKNIISVRSGKEDDEKHWIKKVKNTPKTKNSIRYVPLNKGAVKYANIVLDQFREGEMFVYTINGCLVNPSSLNKYLDTILKNAGVNKKGGVHVLRDTFASRLFDSGTDIQTISKILGHANSRITEEHYIQILNSRKMKAVNLIDYI